MTRLRRLLPVLAALALAPTALRAQSVEVEGGDQYRAVQLLREVLHDERYLLLERDTVLPADFRAAGDLLVIDADVRMEGQVEGRVVVVGGTLFVRPGGRVAGMIASIGGAIYPSRLATVGETVATPAGVRVRVSPRPMGYLVSIISPPPAPAVVLPGVLGLRLPTYDRVDGLTVTWGPQWRILRQSDGPTLDLWGAFHTAREAVAGGARLDVPLGAGVHALGEAARATLTNEWWIRSDLTNTLGTLFLGHDQRDYYESDYAALTLARPLPAGPFTPGLAAAPRLTLLLSRDRSLPVSSTWSLLGGDEMRRSNLPIDAGRVLFLTAGTEVAWQGGSSAFRGDVLVERALPGSGRLDFTRWLADGTWDFEALWNHRVTLHARGMGPLSEGALPRQRWSFLGGIGTLPTFELAEFRGDRLVFIESAYAVPLTFVEVPLVGPPIARLMHSAGIAWTSGSPMPPWEQNVGVGVRLLVLDAALFIDPTRDSFRPILSFGLTLPR